MRTRSQPKTRRVMMRNRGAAIVLIVGIASIVLVATALAAPPLPSAPNAAAAASAPLATGLVGDLTKAEREQAYVALQAAGATSGKTKAADAGQPMLSTVEDAAPAPLPETAAGSGTIIESGPFAPWPAAAGTFLNQWTETKASDVIRVFAGGENDTPQGFVIVVHSDGRPVARVATPTLGGPVRITGASGERLLLAAADGSVFTFDVPTEAFVK